MEQYRKPSMSLDEAYGAVEAWLDRAGVRVQRALAPVDGVVEFWAGDAVGRIKWSRTVLNQGAILALLRAEETVDDERRRQPLLFSLTGYTPGAISVADSQDVALFSIDDAGNVLAVNPAAVAIDPGPAPVPPPPETIERETRTEPDRGWISCPSCAATLHPDANFCAACGFDLHAPVPEAPAPMGESVPTAPPGLPQLRCRTCGSNDIELIRPT